MVTTGAVRHAKLQSNCHDQQTNTQLFTVWMPFLSPTNSCKALQGKVQFIEMTVKMPSVLLTQPNTLVMAKKDRLNTFCAEFFRLRNNVSVHTVTKIHSEVSCCAATIREMRSTVNIQHNTWPSPRISFVLNCIMKS